MSTMAKFGSSVSAIEADDPEADPMETGLRVGTLMCDGDNSAPPPSAWPGECGDEADDLPEDFVVGKRGMPPLTGVFCCLTPGDFSASGGCFGF